VSVRGILPLTAIGKVDRKALPSPEGGPPESTDEYVAPRTVLEKFLVKVSQRVFKFEKICIHDNFFAVGGNTLVAIQFMPRLRNVLELDIPLRTLFQTKSRKGRGKE